MRLVGVLAIFNNNIIGLCAYLYRNGKVPLKDHPDYTLTEFVADWTGGGKKLIEKHWRFPANKSTGHSSVSVNNNNSSNNSAAADADQEDALDRVKEYYRGAHEWIPTNMLGYVVDCGLVIHKDVRWLMLADALRTPCALVVCLPTVLNDQVANTRGDQTHAMLRFTGHVGALSLGSASNYLFNQQEVFHEQLRKILKAYLNETTNDIRTFFATLIGHIGSTYWQGTDDQSIAIAKSMQKSLKEFKACTCPYHYNSGSGKVESWGKTMADMAELLHKEWPRQLQILFNIFKAIESENPQLSSTHVTNVQPDNKG